MHGSLGIEMNTANLNDTSKLLAKKNEKLRLPETPLISTLGQSAVMLEDQEGSGASLITKKVSHPAKPLSVVLSSNKVAVGEDDLLKNDNANLEKPADISFKLETIKTATGHLSEHSGPMPDENDEVGFQHKLEQGAFNLKDILNEILTKEPRIDIQEQITSNNESVAHQEIIPTFYNKKTQIGMYASTNNASTEEPTASKIESSTMPGDKHNNDAKNDDNTILQDTQHLEDGSGETDVHNVEELPTDQPIMSSNPTCGKLGGAAILQVFGKLTQKLMPDLVANWVTGQNGHREKDKVKQKRARIELEGEFDKHGTEPRIIAGTNY